MKMFPFALLLAVVPTMALAQAPPAETPPAGAPSAEAPAMTDEQFAQMVSYALGRSIADDCKMGGIPLDSRAMMTGINEVQGDKPPQWKAEELNQVMRMFAMRIQQRIADDNLKQGETFLAENAKKPGVQVTPSGLQYKVLQEGDGATPTADNIVACHYRGTFINGSEFDSSLGGPPAQFPVKGVIPGWTEALQLMKVGDKYQLFVPSKLAYGEEGRDRIGPNETLIFEVELLQVGEAGQQ